jgi:uroporphyrin-III C-methyltransferase
MLGKVYLVGAGPGAADLLTVRAVRLLAQADIVFTDALVHADTLALAAKAKIVYVGKRARGYSTDQRFINRALVAAAERHAVVVRLKGGDPMLFARAQEEIEALSAAGIEYEVVPGVTAAFAAAASLGMSLTQRGISRSVTFATSRVGNEHDSDDSWRDALSRSGTTVLYMAAGQAPAILAALLERGFPAATPCAVVRNASLPDEHTTLTTLAHLPTAVHDGLTGPALLIIGEALRAAGGAQARRGKSKARAEPKAVAAGTRSKTSITKRR